MRRDALDRWVLHPVEWIVAALIFAIMALTVVDVVGRYGFNAPVKGSIEAIELMLGVLIYMAIPLASARAEHIRIDLLDYLLGARARQVQRLIGNGATAVVMGFLAWRLYERGVQFAKFKDTSSHLDVPLAPVAWLMAFFAAVTVVVVLRDLVVALQERPA
jgi:TRAP-type C4-dicarboxylate transport system permease small subunit